MTFIGRWSSAFVLVAALLGAGLSGSAKGGPALSRGCGACVGLLSPNRAYRTTVFAPALSYSVPTRGWHNYEDTPGNFLIVPPGNDLAGVNAETSDFVGVYTSVAAARFRGSSACSEERVPGVPNTPTAIVGWLQKQSQLRVTRRAAVGVGALRGVVIDIRARPGAKPPTCTDRGRTVAVFLLFKGLPPSSLAHDVVSAMTMRLYLLKYKGGTLAIEVNDKEAARGTLGTLTAVARRFKFEA